MKQEFIEFKEKYQTFEAIENSDKEGLVEELNKLSISKTEELAPLSESYGKPKTSFYNLISQKLGITKNKDGFEINQSERINQIEGTLKMVLQELEELKKEKTPILYVDYNLYEGSERKRHNLVFNEKLYQDFENKAKAIRGVSTQDLINQAMKDYALKHNFFSETIEPEKED